MLRIAAILTSDRRKEVKTATIRNLIPPNETSMPIKKAANPAANGTWATQPGFNKTAPQSMRSYSRKQQTVNPTSRTEHCATAAYGLNGAAMQQLMTLCRESNAKTPPRFRAA